MSEPNRVDMTPSGPLTPDDLRRAQEACYRDVDRPHEETARCLCGQLVILMGGGPAEWTCPGCRRLWRAFGEHWVCDRKAPDDD